jgi:hypothetical protein
MLDRNMGNEQISIDTWRYVIFGAFDDVDGIISRNQTEK